MGVGLGNTIRFRIDEVAVREVEEPEGDVKKLDTRRL